MFIFFYLYILFIGFPNLPFIDIIRLFYFLYLSFGFCLKSSSLYSVEIIWLFFIFIFLFLIILHYFDVLYGYLIWIMWLSESSVSWAWNTRSCHLSRFGCFVAIHLGVSSFQNTRVLLVLIWCHKYWYF